MVAVAAPVALATSARRSGRISARCRLLTNGWDAQVAALMPPHQPVPMMPTPICFITHLPSDAGAKRLLGLLDHRGLTRANRDLLCWACWIGIPSDRDTAHTPVSTWGGIARGIDRTCRFVIVRDLAKLFDPMCLAG